MFTVPEFPFGVEEITTLIPHRYPFLLLDRVTTWEEGKSIEGLKNVTINEPFFQGHFPDLPIMPGVLIIESLAQLGAVFTQLENRNQGAVLTLFRSISRAKFKRPVKPGDTLELKLTVLKKRTHLVRFQASAHISGELACSAELDAAVVRQEE